MAHHQKDQKSMAAMGSLLQDIYADPPTFMRSLIECSQFIERARHDSGSTKEDVLDSMENRLSLLIGKMASHPTCCAFSIDLPDSDAPAPV